MQYASTRIYRFSLYQGHAMRFMQKVPRRAACPVDRKQRWLNYTSVTLHQLYPTGKADELVDWLFCIKAWMNKRRCPSSKHIHFLWQTMQSKDMCSVNTMNNNRPTPHATPNHGDAILGHATVARKRDSPLNYGISVVRIPFSGANDLEIWQGKNEKQEA